MNAASKKKLAAWLFIQWATGKEAMTRGVKSGAFADPTRQSVFDGAFKQTLGNFPGYLETFETVVDNTAIQFAPQKQFFETTESWAVALQDMYSGADAKSRLDELAEANAVVING